MHPIPPHVSARHPAPCAPRHGILPLPLHHAYPGRLQNCDCSDSTNPAARVGEFRQCLRRIRLAKSRRLLDNAPNRCSTGGKRRLSVCQSGLICLVRAKQGVFRDIFKEFALTATRTVHFGLEGLQFSSICVALPGKRAHQTDQTLSVSGVKRAGNEIMSEQLRVISYVMLALPLLVALHHARYAVAQPNMPRLEHAQVDGKWGYTLPLTEDFRIEPQFELAGPFSEELAPVRIDGKYGYIDEMGRLVIDPQFRRAGPFADGRAAVKLDQGVAYINRHGEILFQIGAEFIGPPSEGLAWFKQEGRYGYVDDQTGMIVIQSRFLNVGSFSDGLAAVTTESGSGYIDKRGEFAIQPRFTAGGPFSEGLAWVYVDNMYGFINKEGQTVFKAEFDMVTNFTRWAAMARRGSELLILLPSGEAVQDRLPKDAKLWNGIPSDATIRVRDRFRGQDTILTLEAMDEEGRPMIATRRTDRFVRVKIESRPEKAAIYIPTKYDYENKPLERLTTHDYRLSEGDTNVETLLDKFAEYRVIFVHDGRKEIRPCRPAVNQRVRAEFP